MTRLKPAPPLGSRLHLFIGLAFFVNGTEDLIHGLLAMEAQRTAAPKVPLLRPPPPVACVLSVHQSSCPSARMKPTSAIPDTTPSKAGGPVHRMRI